MHSSLKLTVVSQTGIFFKVTKLIVIMVSRLCIIRTVTNDNKFACLENFDIASFRGLPAYPPTQESNHHNISSSPSMSSEDRSISPASDRHGENDDRGQVPCVTTVSVGTKPVDARPSAYIGFLEGMVQLCMCG